MKAVARRHVLALALAGACSVPHTALAQRGALLPYLPATRPRLETQPPVAPSRPVTETRHGVDVRDPFRNLEETESPEVRSWARAQDARARRALESYADRPAIEQRLEALTRFGTPLYFQPRAAAGRVFFLERRAPDGPLTLVVASDLRDAGSVETVFDPAAHDLTGRSAIDFFMPSPDGARVAVSLSRGGPEGGTLHVFDVRSGAEMGPRIPRVSAAAGGSVAWDEAGTGFFYTSYAHLDPPPAYGDSVAGPHAERRLRQRLRRHEAGGDPERDPVVLGPELPRLARIELARSDDGRHHLARIADGDGGACQFWLHDPVSAWRLVADFEHRAERACFGRDDAIYFLSAREAPTRSVVRMPLSATSIDAAEGIVEANGAVYDALVATRSHLYVIEMLGGLSRLRIYGLDGSPRGAVEMGDMASLTDLVARGGDEILFRHQSYTDRPAWFLHSPARRAPARTALVHESATSFTGVEVRREIAYAGDGTEIPLTLFLPAGLVRDGRAPALVTGYGAYGITLTPSFDPARRLWIDQGGVYAVANVRGGGAFGEAWHRAATGENKRRSIDDLAACARHVVAAGYSSPDRVAVEGQGAGGLLAYATAVLYPERVAAVVARAPVADVLRRERSARGAFDVPELGTVENPVQFRAMAAYSPYHNVVNGERYPAVLSFAGVNDPYAEPWHAFKMTARLLHARSPGRVLLRTSDSPADVQTRLPQGDRADAFTFLFQELGIRFRAESRTASADRSPSPGGRRMPRPVPHRAP